MKIKAFLLILITFIFSGFCSYGQDLDTFLHDLNILEHSTLATIKGPFILKDDGGDSYYQCTKPLLGFTTLIAEEKNTGKLVLKAVPGKKAPFPPNFDDVISKLTKISVMLGNFKRDSDTDPNLEDEMKKFPTVTRIVIFSDDDTVSGITFFQSKDGQYIVSIVTKY